MYAGPARRAQRRALIFVVSALGAAALAAASAAAASAATIAVANGTATPEQAVPVQLTMSGTADTGSDSNVEAVVRASGGLACQPDFASDVSAAGSADTILFGSDAQSVSPGAYSVTATYKPPAAGGYQVCAWLTQTVSGTSQTVAGPATVSFTARGPQVSQLSVSVPETITPNVVFQLAYTTQTDQQLSLYSVIKKAGALPCASSFELERAQSQPETTLLGYGARQVFGGPSQTTLTDREAAGSYLICSWIEGPASGEVDDALSTAVTVGTATTPTSGPAALSLRLSKLSASRRHGVTASGTVARGFTGRLRVLAACGSSRRTGSPRARSGRYSSHLRLPAGCRKGGKLKVTVSYGGSSVYRKASASRSAKVGA